MIDPACELRTWMDALYVGRACDEAGYFWYEDPYRDSGVSAVGHQRLREKLKTPLLVSEHVRGLEQKAAFMLAGGCDMIHADPEYDMGITGAMKIAHFCEAMGLDVQFHACGPAHRAVMAATRNTHFYEMALIGPGMPNAVPPVYTCGYSDQPDDRRQRRLRARAGRARPRRHLRLGVHREEPPPAPRLRPRLGSRVECASSTPITISGTAICITIPGWPPLPSRAWSATPRRSAATICWPTSWPMPRRSSLSSRSISRPRSPTISPSRRPAGCRASPTLRAAAAFRTASSPTPISSDPQVDRHPGGARRLRQRPRHPSDPQSPPRSGRQLRRPRLHARRVVAAGLRPAAGARPVVRHAALRAADGRRRRHRATPSRHPDHHQPYRHARSTATPRAWPLGAAACARSRPAPTSPSRSPASAWSIITGPWN